MVFQLVRLIPKGRVCSYGVLAKAIGRPGNARQVGQAMARAGQAKTPVPAHRVVNSSGMLSGAAAFPEKDSMQQMLEKEGVPVRKNRIVDLKSYFWNPLTELENE